MESLAVRTGFLLNHQNPDGGWGYFPGKQSWLEPTAYAALALLGSGGGEASARAWSLLRSWQNEDGGWRPNRHPGASTWCTALAVLFGGAVAGGDPSVTRGVRWLIASAGAESSLLNRIVRRFGVLPAGREVEHRGWPWRPGASSWVEPTALSLAVLRRAARRRPAVGIAARIRTGERMLLSVRCADGGWNYGAPRALGVELPSYPETTALAVVGLGPGAPGGAVDRARNWFGADGVSPLARAWLDVALRLAGDRPPAAFPPWDGGDVLLCGIQSLALTGNWRLLGGGPAA